MPADLRHSRKVQEWSYAFGYLESSAEIVEANARLSGSFTSHVSDRATHSVRAVTVFAFCAVQGSNEAR